MCKSAKNADQGPPSVGGQVFRDADEPVFTGERARQLLDAFDDWSSKRRGKKLRGPRSRATDQGMSSTESHMR